MKNNLILLFLAIGFYGFVRSQDVAESRANGQMKSQDDEGIYYPCKKSDTDCIRKYFAANSHCKPAYGPVPDPFIMKQNILRLANSNMTFILNNGVVKGLDGKITSFYINKKTDNLVLAFEISPLTIISPHSVIRYQRRGKEPIVRKDAAYISYGSVTITAIIPNIKNLQYAETEVYSYIDDNNPPYGLGPEFIKSFNPVVHKSFTKLVKKIMDNAKEALVFQGPIFMDVFMRSNICDFGYKIKMRI